MLVFSGLILPYFFYEPSLSINQSLVKHFCQTSFVPLINPTENQPEVSSLWGLAIASHNRIEHEGDRKSYAAITDDDPKMGIGS